MQTRPNSGFIPEGNWYKISSKEDVDLFIEELLIKEKL